MFDPKELYKKHHATDEAFRGFPMDGMDQYYAFGVVPSNDVKIYVPSGSDEHRILEDKKLAPVIRHFVLGVPEDVREIERP